MVPKQEQQQEDKKTVLATSKELISSSISTTNRSKSSKRRRTQPDSTSSTNSTTTSSEGTSFLSSTEESYGVNNLEFYGPFAHIRRDYIDYSYHSNYKISRQRFQNCIIWELLDPGRVVVSNNKNNSSSSAPSSSSSSPPFSCSQPTEPWCIFVAGAFGSNKRKTIVSLVETGRLPLLSFCYIDTDEISRHFPEYHVYIESTVPKNAIELTKKEAGLVAEILLWSALEAGKNVLYSGRLKHTIWYNHLFQKIRNKFSSVRIAILHIDAPLECLKARVADRALTTGVITSDEDIANAYEQVPKSVEELRPKADYYCKLINSFQGLEISSEQQTWDDFRSNWYQTCAWPSSAATAALPNTSSKVNLIEPEQQQLQQEQSTLLQEPHCCSFSLSKSTEENYKSDDMKFYGLYANLRERLDYSYHCNYTKDRQFFQDTIIDDTLRNVKLEDINGDTCKTPTEPIIVFTAGAMGSGKSHTITKLVEKGHFPLRAFVKVDPDEIRRQLPEFMLYASLCPEDAGELTNKECGYVSEIITLAGLESGKNVLVDGSLRDSDWYKVYFQMLRDRYSHLKIAILHIVAPRVAVFQRAISRGAVTGRVIPIKTLEMALEQVPKSVKILAPLADYCCELNNAPDKDDIEIMTEGEDWDSFRSQWLQLCAWVPRKRSKAGSEVQYASKTN